MVRIRLKHPRLLLSVSEDGQTWQLDNHTYQLAAMPIVLWRLALITPLIINDQRHWFWLWWFQLTPAQLSQLRCLAVLAARH